MEKEQYNSIYKCGRCNVSICKPSKNNYCNFHVANGLLKKRYFDKIEIVL